METKKTLFEGKPLTNEALDRQTIGIYFLVLLGIRMKAINATQCFLEA